MAEEKYVVIKQGDFEYLKQLALNHYLDGKTVKEINELKSFLAEELLDFGFDRGINYAYNHPDNSEGSIEKKQALSDFLTTKSA